MKLFYFPLKARAETARLMIKVGGVECEDVVFDFKEWAEKYKALSPSGQAPYLELDDGRTITQSSAINMYVANLAGFQPSDPMQVARTVELVCLLEDVWSTGTPSMSIKDADEKLAARQALIQPDGAMTKKLKVAEKLIAAVKTEYYCGDQPTLADYHLYTWLSFVRSGFLDGVSKEFLDSFEKMSTLRSKVASLPKVKEIYADVPGFEA